MIYAWIIGWVNNREAGDLRRYRAHYDVVVMHIKMIAHETLVKVITKRIWKLYI